MSTEAKSEITIHEPAESTAFESNDTGGKKPIHPMIVDITLWAASHDIGLVEIGQLEDILKQHGYFPGHLQRVKGG